MGGERKRREKGVDRGLELRMSTCMVRPVSTTYSGAKGKTLLKIPVYHFEKF